VPWGGAPALALSFVGALDHNQTLIVNTIMADHFNAERIAAGCGACLLRLEAGRGKTFVAAALIGFLKLRTLFIVTKLPLQSQAVVDLRSVLTGNITEYTSTSTVIPDVAVVVINTALGLKKEILSQFHFVVYDEVQKLHTGSRKHILRDSMTWVNLGMTATPHRLTDEFDAIYKKELALGGKTDGVIDGILVADALSGYRTDDVAFDINIHVIHYYGPDEYTQNVTGATGKLSPLLMQKQFISDPYRMKLVARELSTLVNWQSDGKRHGIYIFCEERAQLDVVYEALRNEHDIDAPELDKESGKFIGGISKKEIKKMAETARIYLTTYGYSSEGISNNSMTAEIYCTSRRNNMEQITGRIMRRNGDPSIPRVIIDIVDEKTALRHQFNTRKTDYNKRQGVTYHHHTVKYDELT
jgi:superfamily II DNA or RNA helicase